MPIFSSHCLFDDGLGDQLWFDVATNKMHYFEIGQRQSLGHWLEGQLVGPSNDLEPIFNGRLFVPGLSSPGTIIDNFPKGPAPSGWEVRPRIDSTGFNLTSVADGVTIFGYRIVGNLCRVTANVYDQRGILCAETSDDTFSIHHGPAQLGRGGVRYAA
jgi:hypothetical protein